MRSACPIPWIPGSPHSAVCGVPAFGATACQFPEASFMRQVLAALALVLGMITAPLAQVSVSIGINLGAYPQLVRVPGYPVYYAPQVNSNYFFYDGMYWVYAYDNWYASTWYNGPWELVAPCLLYTSDAADERSSVDLGGRRII